GLRRDAPFAETLRADGPLGGLVDGLMRLPEDDGALDRAAEDVALKARAQEAEAERLSPTLGAGQAARLSPDTAAFRAELA
ncbi:hypothetical protein, partial [Klebsiella pneumoniae]|uniref:hypothetical protein n=1 Tax=Klebsiella pneumoniae TaxID=573 RepID=UPI0013D1DA69